VSTVNDHDTAEEQPSQEGFHAEVNSGLEPILVERLFTPLLRWVPESVAPNTISLIGTLVAWLTLGLTYLSTQLAPLGQGLALAGAGVGVFLSMTADCLDGMQARRTGRTSKLGEFLDHWLDAVHVPMVSAGLGLALGLEPWQVVLILITTTLIYNAQLVLYHFSGRFVHPGTSGVDGQFFVSLGYLAAALLLPTIGINPLVKTGMVLIAGAVQLRLNVFYYPRLGRHIVAHIPFVLLCVGYAVLYLLGAMDTLAFSLLVIIVSWRVTGTWVLRTITKRAYSGWDFSALLWLMLLTAAHFVPTVGRSLGAVLPCLAYVICAVLVAHNLGDLARHYRELL